MWRELPVTWVKIVGQKECLAALSIKLAWTWQTCSSARIVWMLRENNVHGLTPWKFTIESKNHDSRWNPCVRIIFVIVNSSLSQTKILGAFPYNTTTYWLVSWCGVMMRFNWMIAPFTKLNGTPNPACTWQLNSYSFQVDFPPASTHKLKIFEQPGLECIKILVGWVIRVMFTLKHIHDLRLKPISPRNFPHGDFKPSKWIALGLYCLSIILSSHQNSFLENSKFKSSINEFSTWCL